MKILIVEDETGLQEALIDLLTGAGHQVEAVSDGESAVQRGLQGDHDLVLLDLMLPGINGIEVARRLRAARPRIYILMLTARGSEEDKVGGLRAGADDYVTKPFAAKELLARVEAFARRASTRPAEIEEIVVDGCHLDLGRCTALREELPAEVVLTAREASILRCLHLNRARAVSRAELLESVWGAPGDLRTRTVDMTIANLRQKIERDPREPRIVVTIKGIGYAWGDR